MYVNKVEICGVNTAKLPVLKEKEKMALIARIKEGDKSARDELVQGNLRLVLSVVQKFSSRGENPDDLFQVGCIGLMKAIDNFDDTQGVRFSTYGVPMIVGEIRRYLRDNNSVRVSRSLRDTAYQAMQVRERLQGAHKRTPNVDEIAMEMSLPKHEVVMALESIVEPISLHEPVYSDGGDTIYVMDQIRDPERDTDWLDEIMLKESIRSLSNREKQILSLRFITGKTQMEVANEVGISQAQVSRLEKGALDKIKSKK